MNKKNIVLCGFMGAGKSTVGKALAKRLNLPFFDSDRVIEEKLKSPVADIFKNYGESYFREAEKAVIAELCQKKLSVISLGGGALCSSQNTKAIKNNGKIFFLDANFSTIKKRLKGDATRPLFVASSEKDFENLFEERKNLYVLHADVVIDADEKADDICDRILFYLDSTV